MLDGPLARLVHKLVIPLLKLYIYMLLPNKILRHGILATYERAACLVRMLAHPPAKMYLGFPHTRLDGPLARLIYRLVIPLLKLYITFAPLNTATVHGIPTYLATYQHAFML